MVWIGKLVNSSWHFGRCFGVMR